MQAVGAPLPVASPGDGLPFHGETVVYVQSARHGFSANMFLNGLMVDDCGQRLLEEACFTSTNVNVKPADTGVAADLAVGSELSDLGMIEIPQDALESVDDWIQQWTQMVSGG